MPRHPEVSPSVTAIRESAFSAPAHRLAAKQATVYRLHVGDTWREPPEGCRMEDLRVADHPGMHRYASPHGLTELLDAIADRVAARTHVATGRDDVLVTAGATGALGAAGDAWLDEVRRECAEVGRLAAERLGVAPPEGSTFLFLDVADRLDGRGLAGLLEDCAAEGLFLAPGPSFGPYPTHVRICFTASPPEVVARGVELLAGLLEG